MKRISILIPTFNDACYVLVSDLVIQAQALATDYEVIVADDASDNPSVIADNRRINLLPHCRYIERNENVGRAAIRNYLVQESHYPWLLFIDSDMHLCRDGFLASYQKDSSQPVVYGGIVIGNVQDDNLRSLYEKAAAPLHTVAHRSESPYADFHTANFMVRRDIMVEHPFDTRFRYYGYEDVLLGKTFQQYGIGIAHIDNPVSFEVFESNDDFLKKTEEGLRTLHQFRSELCGYSRLLDIVSNYRLLMPAVRLWHRLFGRWERSMLAGPHPNLTVFKLYRLGYYLSL